MSPRPESAGGAPAGAGAAPGRDAPVRTVGRLAPTPSGHLHLGNALAFGAAWLAVRMEGGRLLLRIEDLDRGRSRAEVAAAQRADLRWLGVDWDHETPPQSTRAYPVDGLPSYRCDCSRRQRLAGACRCAEVPRATGRLCFRCPRVPVAFTDELQGPQCFTPDHDPTLLQRDGSAAYPLAVVVDDHRDGVNQVVRGADLLAATAEQRCIGAALGIAAPRTLHVPVLLGPDGRKLSKSHGSTELRALRERGWTPAAIWARLLPVLGLPPVDLAAVRPEDWAARAARPGPVAVDDLADWDAPPGAVAAPSG